MGDWICFGLLTIAMVAAEIYFIKYLLDYFRIKHKGCECQAVIIKFYQFKSAYYPVVMYDDEKGKSIVGKADFGVNFKGKRFKEGGSLKIYFDRDKPEKFVVCRDSLYVRIAGLAMVTMLTLPIVFLFVSKVLGRLLP